MVDTHSRFCPATDLRFAARCEDVVQTLEHMCGQIGYPKTIRVDNGSEFISKDMDLWAYANGVTLDFSRPAARQLFACKRREGGASRRTMGSLKRSTAGSEPSA